MRPTDFSAPATPAFAAQLEQSEVNAWLDLYAAVPADFARQFQPEVLQVQGVVLTRCRTIPFVHFNCAMNLGMLTPASEQQLDEVLALYRQVNMRSFALFHIPHSQPAALPTWFKARGLRLVGGWDRIYRDNQPLDPVTLPGTEKFQVEKITAATAEDWASFLDKCYGLPTKPWLLALATRTRWHHYALRAGARIVAVRSMYVHEDGWAWWGVEAPVPGLMAPSFDLDVQLCYAMVRDGLALGARYFVADIEAPSATLDTPAYQHFAALGFKRPYFRSHYALG